MRIDVEIKKKRRKKEYNKIVLKPPFKIIVQREMEKQKPKTEKKKYSLLIIICFSAIHCIIEYFECNEGEKKQKKYSIQKSETKET